MCEHKNRQEMSDLGNDQKGLYKYLNYERSVDWTLGFERGREKKYSGWTHTGSRNTESLVLYFKRMLVSLRLVVVE